MRISAATEKNWSRLKTDPSTRLKKRANKTESKKRIVPVEYVINRENVPFIEQLLDKMTDNGWAIQRVLYSLSVCLLNQKGIRWKQHVQAVLDQYPWEEIQEISGMEVPADEWDLLGAVYQSALQEGERNAAGVYYTPRETAQDMVAGLSVSHGERFLDPCCGSGSFLLAVCAEEPEQLVGFDDDPIAVMIAKVNLLLQYSQSVFVPQVFCLDYLAGNPCCPQVREGLEPSFDYIVTNPPWGVRAAGRQRPVEIPEESFSRFFMQAYQQLKEQGTIRFLFPEAILNVKAHRDIRVFMLESCRMEQITRYDTLFSGVMTKYVGISCKKAEPASVLVLQDAAGRREIQTSGFYQTEHRVFCFPSSEDLEILQKIRARGRYDLSDSTWALGIVTGDNKNKLSGTCEAGMEPIYTGKEITRYELKPAKHYLRYDRTQLQQAAREEYYRAEEKLVYKFISNRLVFAYDASGSLFLNSANLLIPKIPGMDIKTVLAFLNSDVFQYVYSQLFGEVKLLKGNLQQLPFPSITETQNRMLSSAVDGILGGDKAQDREIQTVIYEIYKLSEAQVRHMRRRIDGTIDGGTEAGDRPTKAGDRGAVPFLK